MTFNRLFREFGAGWHKRRVRIGSLRERKTEREHSNIQTGVRCLGKNGRGLYRERITGRESITKVQPGCTTCARFGAVSECCAKDEGMLNKE